MLIPSESKWLGLALVGKGYDCSSPALSPMVQGLLLCISDPTFHHTLVEADRKALVEDNLLAWFKLYTMAIADPPTAITRLKNLQRNLSAITESDAKEEKDWLESSPNLMRRFMEGLGQRLRNDPLVRQRKKHLLNGFAEVVETAPVATESLLLPAIWMRKSNP
ncbi:hypothetical protein GOP47_0012367 [Adiantum capillus-veneris]|uniref:Uncharacterized protein n=1 Tax=Adiantum capillus-veneris TaxID=13818 RepID=A0A9D4UQS8_ADICA|nr:hypothetical protein GOP47_0012367 [Adiantum capillus-veneris]